MSVRPFDKPLDIITDSYSHENNALHTHTRSMGEAYEQIHLETKIIIAINSPLLITKFSLFNPLQILL